MCIYYSVGMSRSFQPFSTNTCIVNKHANKFVETVLRFCQNMLNFALQEGRGSRSVEMTTGASETVMSLFVWRLNLTFEDGLLKNKHTQALVDSSFT